MRIFKIILILFVVFATTTATFGQCMDTKTYKIADQLSRELQTSMNNTSKQQDKCHYFVNLPQIHSFELINSEIKSLVDRYSNVSLEYNWVEKQNEKGPVYTSALKIGEEWATVDYFVGDDLVGFTYFIQKDISSIEKITGISQKGVEFIEYTLENLIFIHGLSGSSLESHLADFGLEGENFKGNVSYMTIKNYGMARINMILFNQGNRKNLVYQSDTGNFPSELENSFDQLKKSLKDNFAGTAPNGDSVYTILVGNQNYVIGLNKKEGQISAGIKSQ